MAAGRAARRPAARPRRAWPATRSTSRRSTPGSRRSATRTRSTATPRRPRSCTADRSRRRRWRRSGRCTASTRQRPGRRPAARDDGRAGRGRVHLGARHQLRPDLRPLPPPRRAGQRHHAAGVRRRPEEDRRRGGLLRHHPQRLAGRRRAGRDDAVPGAEVQARAVGSGDAAVDQRPEPHGPADGQPGHRLLLGGHRGRRAQDPALQRLRRCCGTRPGRCARRATRPTAATSSPPAAGRVYSYVIHHAPQIPGKQLPLLLAVVELEEGVRMVGELRGAAAGRGRRSGPAGARSGSTGSTTS